MTSTVDALRHFAAHAPERPAVRMADRQWRYRELHDAAMSFAHSFAAHDVRSHVRGSSGDWLYCAARQAAAWRAARPPGQT